MKLHACITAITAALIVSVGVPARGQSAQPAPADAPRTTTTQPAAQAGTAAPPAAPAAPATAAAGTAAPATALNPAAVASGGVTPPPGYVIGADDQLAIVFWREKDLSTETTVRPDGKISIPLLNDVEASGLTPEQLRAKIFEAANKFVEDPTVTVVVKQINSRRVYITGQVGKPGPYALGGPTTVLQLIAMAGGVNEYADDEHIVVVRNENGKTTSIEFNYKDVSHRKKLQTNIELKPGDTVIVP
jgi:polysaccharide export outer membrane protein